MTNLLQFTINVRKSNREPQCNLSALCNSCAKFARCSSGFIFTSLCAGGSIQNASGHFVSRIHL